MSVKAPRYEHKYRLNAPVYLTVSNLAAPASGEGGGINVCVFKKKLFAERCMMSVCLLSVGYTVHVSRVHFLHRDRSEERWDREMGTSG